MDSPGSTVTRWGALSVLLVCFALSDSSAADRSVGVSWLPQGEVVADGYQLYVRTGGSGWIPIADFRTFTVDSAGVASAEVVLNDSVDYEMALTAYALDGAIRLESALSNIRQVAAVGGDPDPEPTPSPDPDPDPEPGPAGTPVPSGSLTRFTGDFDGDGANDVYAVGGAGAWFCADGDLGDCLRTHDQDWSAYRVHDGDFDGDGRRDLFLVGRSEDRFCSATALLSGGSCRRIADGWLQVWTSHAGDFDGDGITDLYLAGAASNYYCAGPGVAGGNNCVLAHRYDWRNGVDIEVLDTDGDGARDLHVTVGASTWVCAGPQLAAGNPCVPIGSPPPPAPAPDPPPANGPSSGSVPYAGDYDGDGDEDVYAVGSTGSWLCDSGEMVDCARVHTEDWTQYRIHPGDFDGDGVGDLFLVGTADDRFCAGEALVSGSGCATVAGGWLRTWISHAGDFDGNGITDLYLVGAAGSYYCAGPGIAVGNNCILTHRYDWKNWATTFSGDFDGNGTTDIYVISNNSTWFCPGLLLVASPSCARTGDPSGWRDNLAIRSEDLNGDGVTDLRVEQGTNQAWSCYGPGISETLQCEVAR